MSMEFGLYPTKHTDEEPQGCQGSVEDGAPCNREIKEGDELWLDTQENRVLCDACGRCLRFDRKNEELRQKRGIKERPLIKGLDY